MPTMIPKNINLDNAPLAGWSSKGLVNTFLGFAVCSASLSSVSLPRISHPRAARRVVTERDEAGLELRMGTFFWYFQLPTLDYFDRGRWLIIRAFGDIFDLLHDIVAFHDFPEDNMTPIQPARDGGGDEELRPVGVLSGICHAQEPSLGVLELEVLVWEFGPID